MLFDEKKIDVVSIEDLMQCPISSVDPYSLMLAPIYVLMKKNEKLVSVKAPLDFFTPGELENLRVYQRFYIPKFIQSVSRFQTAAKIVRSLMSVDSKDLPPAPYELSREVMKVMGSLWGKDYRVEPFFASVFADELCGSLEPEKMLKAREATVVRHDLGLLLSGAIVFVLLQLGWFDFEFLKEIRKQTYERTTEGEEWKSPQNTWESINKDLVHLIESQIPLDPDSLAVLDSEWAKKILARVRRLEKIPSFKKYESLTIYGPEGFAA